MWAGRLCAYLDDRVVFSETWEEHLDRVKALFKKLVWALLTVATYYLHYHYYQM